MPKRTGVKKGKIAENKEDLLISYVKQYPVLYTIKHERYYDTKFKAGIWTTIADILKEEKDLVQSSWDSIKNKYKREKKKVEQAAAVKEIYQPQWIHYSSLQFLDEGYLPRTTASNLDNLFIEKPESVGTMDKPTLELIQSLISPSKATNSDSSGKVENQLNTCATASDEDSTFFNSLLAHVRRVPVEKKLAMRNDIQNIIMSYAYPMPEEKTGCCSTLNCATTGQKHIDNDRVLTPQPTYVPIKTERVQRKPKIKVNYDTDDSDCEYVGHAIPVTKVIARSPKKKRTKKQAFTSGTPSLLQVNQSSQQMFQQFMLQQQQQYQMLQNLYSAGTRPLSAPAATVTTATPPDANTREPRNSPKTRTEDKSADDA